MNQSKGKHPHALIPAIIVLGVLLVIAACAGTSGGAGGGLSRYSEQLNLHVALIPKGKYGRRLHRPMRPTYITVHSTATYPSFADADHFARALSRGYLKASNNLLGYLTWHFTVDESSVYQHLPLNERGEHADYEGKGNKKSIGIEMCENRGNSRSRTIERTARLVAILMKQRNIPISRVVPHYHWERIQPRTGKNIGRKSCPHFLMDNGRPGAKWQAFLNKVQGYRNRL